MTVKRPFYDLMALTADHAAPMPEASQRAAPVLTKAPSEIPARVSRRSASEPAQNLEALAFKVAPSFRRRFRGRAAAADLKLNELLFEALDAWEEKRGLKI